MSFSGKEATVVVAVGCGGRSRRAVRWAAENLGPFAHRLLLLHVIPSISSIPSPSGERIPIENLEREVVEIYVQDQKLKAQEVFFQFRSLCGKRKLETLVLEGESIEAAIVRYVIESGIKNLVLGCSSFNWIRRILRRPDIATTIMESAPNFCNIFAVSRLRLKMKFSHQLFEDELNSTTEIRTISLKTFTRREEGRILGKQAPASSFQDSETSLKPRKSDASTYSQTSSGVGGYSEIASVSSGGYDKEILTFDVKTGKRYEPTGSLKDTPFVLLHTIKEGEASAEVVRLRMELQKTLAMYNRTCEDLVLAKNKVRLLIAECSEESKKVKDALEREEALKQSAKEEQGRHLEALKEVQENGEFLAKEELDRYKAEIAASKMSWGKSKKANALFSDDRRCRIYSSHEIEVATNNFSDAKKIGEGGFGDVYKCNLDHIAVAVKVLRHGTPDKSEEFIREIEVLSQLHHPNMVLLLGFCPENGCLVYEYMENGSLEDHLFCNKGKLSLPWYIRFKIIFEVACGLAFLHGTKPEPIVHRDLKPGNILLDRNFVGKIGDVGLAKIMSEVVPDGFTEYRETVIAGTFPYIDPEYHRTGTLRPKSDLYAFGIISLQLLTAKQPNGLVRQVEKAINGGSLANILDKSISDWPLVEAERLAKLALKCSGLRCRDRPDLETEVMPQLEELVNMANVCFKLRKFSVFAPTHFICPILQEIMENPYIAADGFTYEHRAIKAWLEKHDISPVTKLGLSHTNIIPNYTVSSAIQEWRSRVASSIT
ncbi:Non-specific serine/threonine protein kinase protein [Dioscorea alata]|uniref:Non-specific serine/threonine protein kinase protein n=1 Tax=Dioscorea alata TaxID=55571 RepID=A0ACB7W3B7_DIOAL|nr:Non-specific serine/threonine protein kinase protein [Dioscorea alata]